MTEEKWNTEAVPALIGFAFSRTGEEHFFRVDLPRKSFCCAAALARKHWNVLDTETRELLTCLDDNQPAGNYRPRDVDMNDIERMLDRNLRFRDSKPDVYGALWLFYGVAREFPEMVPHAPFDGWRDIIRDIFGNPFRPVAFSPEWRTSTVVSLARGMYDSRDFSAMPILADALQDAGCEQAEILDHCRGSGPHVRGCWVVDLALGKS